VATPDILTPEQLDRAIPALLKLALQSGDRAYTDPIDRFDPAPSADNNWLMQDDGSFAGVFVDDQPDGTEKRVRFVCTKGTDGWETETELDGGSEFAEAISLSGDTDLLDDAEWDALAAGVSDPNVISEAMEAIALLDNQ